MRIAIVVLTAAAFCLVLSAWQVASKSVRDGVYTTEQAQRGQPLYKQYCASCHGDSLEGIEMAPALAGPDFIDEWSGQTVGDLFERIRATIPRDKPGRLSREINVDIAAYMLSFNRFPAGSAELSQDTQALKQIRIEAAKTR